MNDDTRLYAMATRGGGTIRHFKIGITSNLIKRMSDVQAGCPTPISSVLSVILPSRFTAAAAEKEMHGLLAEYHSIREWFTFDVANPQHKSAFNDAAHIALDHRLGKGWTWAFASQKQVRALLTEVRAGAQRQAWEARTAHAYRMAKGMPMW